MVDNGCVAMFGLSVSDSVSFRSSRFIHLSLLNFFRLILSFPDSFCGCMLSFFHDGACRYVNRGDQCNNFNLINRFIVVR